MSDERDEMIMSLKENVIPTLRKRGFKGSFPHFYRKLEEQIDLLMFQFSMWGGVLYVEVSKCSPEGHTDVAGTYRTPNKVKVYHIGDGSAWHRNRLGKVVNGMFEFNKLNIDEVSKQVFNALEEAEGWWNTYPNWWNQ